MNQYFKKLFAGFIILSWVSTPGFSKPSRVEASTKKGEIPVYSYRIVQTYPHDKNAYTQGLVFENGALYEGTGRHGRSEVRKLALKNGEVLMSTKLPRRFFGEGITIYNKKLIQLTWKSRVGFVYDKENFKLINMFYYPTEGWGITHDGSRLIMSDGTSKLYFLNRNSFEIVGSINVQEQGISIEMLNELEYINGEIWANVWQTDRIVRISPKTGQVTGWINLKGLLNKKYPREPVDVLNGIAYDHENDRLFVTGKLWPKLFQIELLPIGGRP